MPPPRYVILFCGLVLFQNHSLTRPYFPAIATLFAVGLVAGANKGFFGNKFRVFPIVIISNGNSENIVWLVLVPCAENNVEVFRNDAQSKSLFRDGKLFGECHKRNGRIALCNSATGVQVFQRKEVAVNIKAEHLEVVFPDEKARSIDKFIVLVLNHQQPCVVSVGVPHSRTHSAECVHVTAFFAGSVIRASHTAQNGKVTNVCAQFLVASAERKVVYSHD